MRSRRVTKRASADRSIAPRARRTQPALLVDAGACASIVDRQLWSLWQTAGRWAMGRRGGCTPRAMMVERKRGVAVVGAPHGGAPLSLTTGERPNGAYRSWRRVRRPELPRRPFARSPLFGNPSPLGLLANKARSQPPRSGRYAAYRTGAEQIAATEVQGFAYLKRSCHDRCSNPLFFLMHKWKPGTIGALRLGRCTASTAWAGARG
jgi:hypothetical protein